MCLAALAPNTEQDIGETKVSIFSPFIETVPLHSLIVMRAPVVLWNVQTCLGSHWNVPKYITKCLEKQMDAN